MRVLALSVLVVCVSSAPQWDGLKSLVKNLSGDDKPGEVNGDYEQIPYEVLAKANVSQCCHSVLLWTGKWFCSIGNTRLTGLRGEEVPQRDVRLHRDDLRHA